MSTVEYDTERYLDELDKPERPSMWDDEDFQYERRRDAALDITELKVHEDCLQADKAAELEMRI